MKKLLVTALLLATSAAANAEWVNYTHVDQFTDQTFKMTGNSEDSIMLSCNFALLSFGKKMHREGDVAFMAFRVDMGEIEYVVGEWFGDAVAVTKDSRGWDSLLDGMKKGRKIAFRATDYNAQPQTWGASLMGFSAAYNKMGCK